MADEQPREEQAGRRSYDGGTSMIEFRLTSLEGRVAALDATRDTHGQQLAVLTTQLSDVKAETTSIKANVHAVGQQVTQHRDATNAGFTTQTAALNVAVAGVMAVLNKVLWGLALVVITGLFAILAAVLSGILH